MTEPLRFERLSIQRMPGFEEGGFTLDDLCPGLNIVHGPNASGKTSSARALEALLWPRSASGLGLLLTGRFRLGEAEWSVDLHGARARYQREGMDASPPALPAEAERDRYKLSLHELLAADNPYFAERIGTETAGGYDVVAAGTSLGPRTAASRPRSELDALESARAAHREAVSRQDEIRSREKRLAELVEKRERARAAGLRVGVLERALEHAVAVDALSAAREALQAFPAALADLRGDEQEQLAKIAARRATLVSEREAAEGKQRAARDAVAEARLPATGLAPELLRGLRADVAKLSELEREAAAAAGEREAARAVLTEERSRFTGAVDDARLGELGHEGMQGLAAFAKKAAELRRQDLELEAAARVLGPSEPAHDVRALSEAIAVLQRWLQEAAGPARGERRHRTLAMIGGAILVAAGFALAAISLWMLVLALLGAGLLLATMAAPSEAPASDPTVRQRDYSQLGLEEPTEWTPAAVRALLERLVERHADAVLAERRAEQRRTLRARREDLAPRLQALEAERAELAHSLGVDPDIEEGHLCWLAQTVGRWQAAHAKLTFASRLAEETGSTAEALRATLRERLHPFGYYALDTHGAIEGAVGALEARDRRVQKGRDDLARAEEDLARLTRDLESCEAERRAIFARVGLAPDDEHTLRVWCDQLQAFWAADEKHRAAENSVAAARRRLQAGGGEEELLSSSTAALQQALTEAKQQGDPFEELVKEIGQIEKAVEEAKEGHAIEEALERIARCEAALAEARERDTRAVISHVLIEHLRQTTMEQHLPEVFHRAKQILSRFTHGRYELRFGGDPEPRFWTFDNTEGRGRGLDELSSGTRVQLLLAVRIAFVETQEREAKLPLVLDEVLGNSDDERAWAIMNAVLELAVEGRQVFYLTAQPDEVRKWEAALERVQGVDHRVIDLAGTRRIQRVVEVPETFSIAAAPVSRALDPAGMSHEEYGRAIGVPAIDRLSARAGSLHLWYLVEDPAELYDMLRLAESWGALEGIVRNGGGPLVSGGAYAAAAALAVAADCYLEEQRVGLGRPVDRLVLEAAGAISETFIDRIDSVARSVDGDARKLIAVMEGREAPEMKGFLARNTGLFREYLEEQGHLPTRDPLPDEELASRTLGSVAGEIAAGVLTIDSVHRLIGRLRLGCR